MRMLLMAQPDVTKGTEAIQSGGMAKTIETAIELLHPEATYFAPIDGRRTMFIVFDMEDPSQIPAISEPMFQMGASVKIVPCMNLEDLHTGLAKLS